MPRIQDIADSSWGGRASRWARGEVEMGVVDSMERSKPSNAIAWSMACCYLVWLDFCSFWILFNSFSNFFLRSSGSLSTNSTPLR